ncbi:MAG: MoaD/ThiS family protein [Pseudomonadota bacterium]
MNPITVLYFGDLMARLQIGREQLRLPPNVADVAGLMRLLALRGGDWQTAFGRPRPSLRITVNKTEAGAATPLKAGDEIAFIEMVSL